jgi:hypothetical protein
MRSPNREFRPTCRVRLPNGGGSFRCLFETAHPIHSNDSIGAQSHLNAPPHSNNPNILVDRTGILVLSSRVTLNSQSANRPDARQRPASRPSQHQFRPFQSPASEIGLLCFQSLAHCPSLLPSFFALCFDTLTNCSVRNSPVLIFMQHALCFFCSPFKHCFQNPTPRPAPVSLWLAEPRVRLVPGVSL